MHERPRASLVLFSRTAALAGVLAAAGAASADTFVCELAPSSNASNVGQLSLPLNGTLIGDYDATTNPSGTQTRPGLFGGSGNNPINFTATIVGDAGFSASPIGSFTMDLGEDGGTISGLALNLTGGKTQEFGITLNINYQTFRTFAPNSTFIGGFTIPVPLAGGEVSGLLVTQTKPAAIISGTPDAEGTPFTALVPVEILLDAQFAGAPVGGEPQTGVFPLVGRYTVKGSTITVTSSLSIPEQTVDLPALPAIENQPLPLPTILPPGGTANLLLNGSFSGGTISSGLSATLVAQGEREVGSNGDINGDGSVNAADLSALLAAWGSAQADADLDGNGIVNGVDLATLLANWG
jgi:hypothetical protein